VTPEEIAHFAGAAQSIAVTIAVVLGGGWTLYTFIRLGTIHKAKAELRKTQRESDEQAVVAIDVNVAQLDRYAGDQFVISGAAVVSNKGNRNTQIDFSAADSCTVTRLDFNELGQPLDVESVSIPIGIVYYLRANASIRFPFVARVPEAGIYRIDFHSPLFVAEASQASTVSGGNHEDYWWDGVAFIAVSERTPAENE
jgi:hypothetical protein